MESAIDQLHTALNSNPFDIIVIDFKHGDIETYKDAALMIKRHKSLQKKPLICLTGIAKKGDAKTLKEIGYSGYLTKPIKQNHLFNCLLMVKNTTDKQSAIEQTGIITKHFIDEFASERFRILIVDDSQVNQKLLSGLLRKLSIRCDIAKDGKAAVAAHKKNKYDLIFMDCHMPVMNGYEASRLIRKEEKNSDKRIPILAITADAVIENKKRCLESGMDEFLTKPWAFDKMTTILKKYLQHE